MVAGGPVRRAVLALCGLALLSPSLAHSRPDPQAASRPGEQELRALAEAWRTAYNAKDAAALASLYAPDGYYVSSHVVARGRAEIQAYFQRGIDGGGHIDSLELLASGQSGDLAYWVGTYQATNAGQKVRGRNIVVVRKVANEWLIVAHESAVADQP
jgi:ketosteroid isomerase-like protein